MPIGDWIVTREDCAGRFELVAKRKPPSKDNKIYVVVLLGAPSPEERETWSIPANLVLTVENYWLLDYLDFREAHAVGGSAALLNALVREADLHKIWIAVNVKPRDEPKEKPVAEWLQRRYGFESFNPPGHQYLLRKPGNADKA